MPLEIKIAKKPDDVFMVSPIGSLDSETYIQFERALKPLLASPTKVIMLDMEKIDYISSMGISAIYKAKKAIEELKGKLIMANLKPQTKKVFELIKTIPGWIFESMQEADEYLDAFLKDQQNPAE